MSIITASEYNNLVQSVIDELKARGITLSEVVSEVTSGSSILSSVYNSTLMDKQQELAYSEIPLKQTDIPVQGSLILDEYPKRITQFRDDLHDKLGCENCVGVCVSGCQGVCKGCSGGCTTGNAANTGCAPGCWGSCWGGFIFPCFGCTNQCYEFCYGCSGACDNNCSGKCSTGCNSNCKTTCMDSCLSDCSNSSRYGVFKYPN